MARGTHASNHFETGVHRKVPKAFPLGNLPFWRNG